MTKTCVCLFGSIQNLKFLPFLTHTQPPSGRGMEILWIPQRQADAFASAALCSLSSACEGRALDLRCHMIWGSNMDMGYRVPIDLRN